MAKQNKTAKKPITLPDDIEELKALALKLHTQLEERTRQRDNLCKEAEELGKYVRANYEETHKQALEVQLRQQWRAACAMFNQSVLKLFSQWPMPIDTQIFEADDWSSLFHAKETARRFQEECSNLQRRATDGIVESEI